MYVPTRTLFGAGLIMISKVYFTHLIDKHVCDDWFVQMAKGMGMEEAKEPMDFTVSICVACYNVRNAKR
jgi:hypothetical protein